MVNKHGGEVDRGWILTSLREVLEAFASIVDPAFDSRRSYADGLDELALDFDNFHSAVVGNLGAEIDLRLRGILQEINDRLSAMSLGGRLFREGLWDVDGCQRDENWIFVGRTARKALLSMGRPPLP